jgi:hypothetical protein
MAWHRVREVEQLLRAGVRDRGVGRPTTMRRAARDLHRVDADMELFGGQLVRRDRRDQRDVGRPQGPACDIGAFELDRFATVALAIEPSIAVNSETGVAIVTGTAICSAQGVVGVEVTLSQAQKVTGKFSSTIEATGTTNINCVGTSSWTVTLTPSTGTFEKGSATETAKTASAFGFLPATVTSTVKAFATK